MNRVIHWSLSLVLCAWGAPGLAQYTVDITVPLEVTALTEAVKRVVVLCFVKVENESFSSLGAGEVAVDEKTGRPVQDRVLVRVVQAKESKGPPADYFCQLRPAGPRPEGPPRGGIQAPSMQSDPNFRPAPGSELVEEVRGKVPVAGRRFEAPRR